jgi:hypothetical protein
MKIAIWQQFSSNHSGAFVVVGRFASEESARDAKEKLSNVIERVNAWHADPANEASFVQQMQGNLDIPLTPIEKTISQEYGIDWGGGIDWYGAVPIWQIGRDIYFDSGESWSDPTPIVNLLKVFGGITAYSTYYEGERFDTARVVITCTLDTPETARQTQEAILDPNGDFPRPPIDYFDDFEDGEAYDAEDIEIEIFHWRTKV